VTLGVIWAQSRTGVIGRDGQMPWHLPEDARYFREVTTGHAVIMGRRTWESLPEQFRPLPHRRNIVISGQRRLRLQGAEVVHSLPEAVALVGDDTAWVIGGGQVYATALGLATLVDVTLLDIDVPGDVHAPPLVGWHREAEGEWQTSTTGVRFRRLRYTRPAPAG
jgi:dihydrofolate reductase